jgi:hypothetical protein
VSAFSVPPPFSTASSAPSRSLAGIASRSTASVRTRYRRQTAALMVGTTVVGLWMALAAPSVSPVATPPPVFSVAAPAGGSTVDPPAPAPARRNDQPGGGPRARDGFGGHRR